MSTIVIVPGYFNQELIDKTIRIGEASGYKAGKVYDSSDPHGSIVLSPKRVCDVAEIDIGSNSWLVNILMHIARVGNSNWQFDINYPKDIHVTRYGVGGHYIFHHDISWIERPTQRKISISIQLSDADSYEGGDLEFEETKHDEQTVKYMRQKGTVIAFPSYLSHRVTPVTRGERKSLVSWIEGPAWR